MRKTAAVLGLLLTAASASTWAATDTEQRPYFSAGYAYTLADSDRESDDGNGFWAGAGLAVDQNWGFELSGFWNDFDNQGSKDPAHWRDYGARLDTQFFYSRDARFSPYVGLAVGGVRSTLRNGSGHSTDPSLDAGVGFFHYLRDLGDGRFAIRGDLRYRWFEIGDVPGVGTIGEPFARLGFAIALGGGSKAASAPADADGDGVPDAKDLCPGTAQGVKVDAKGCPLDSDGDGVPDGVDECPNTPPGIAVNDVGCPASLGSGRFKITGSGAELRFEDVHFEFDQATLTPYGVEMLDDAATVINQVAKKYPGLKIDIAGHTDNTGTPAYNQALSEKRANVVKQHLIRRGVEPGRINVYAYGESKPETSNDTSDGRGQNRRAETRTRAE